MNAKDYRENGFVDMRAYMAQFGADDEAPAQMADHRRIVQLENSLAEAITNFNHKRVLELEAEITRLEGMLTAIKIDAANALSLADMQTDNSARVMVLTEGVRVVLNVALKALGR